MAQTRGKSGSRRKPATRRSGGSGSTLWPWLGALALVAGGIAVYDQSPTARRFVSKLTADKPQQVASRTTPPKPVLPSTGPSHRDLAPKPIDQSRTAAIVPPGLIPPAPVGKPVMEKPVEASVAPASNERLAGAYEAKFFLCGTAKQDDCVVAPDRFMFHGQKIRLVGIEVPDIKKPRCEGERIKASDAELRVRAFLDSGPFELVTWQGNESEIEGHKLREVTRNGKSLADILVNEGLAKRPGAGRGGWC
jgi:hypothetical protein